jgi:coenzyme Q-binding protein COQ10
MPSFKSTRLVSFTPEQMFSLVADVEKYPEFLPLCEGLTVRERRVNGQGHEVLIATMKIGYKAIHEHFTSHVTLDVEHQRIVVDYLEGPFRHLKNTWEFHPVPNGTLVNFHITYEFKSLTLGFIMGAMFDRAFRKFSEAFEARAGDLWRPSTLN